MTSKFRFIAFAFTTCAVLVGLEVRAGFTVKVDFSNPDAYRSYQADVATGLQAAADEWSRYIVTKPVTLDILVNLGTTDATANAGALSTQPVSTVGNVVTSELGSIFKLTQGIDINGATDDAILSIGANWLTNIIWWNPHPGSTNGLPSNKIDSNYVLMHELGHILGFLSDRDDKTGELPVDALGRTIQTTYDALTEMRDGALYFTGTYAELAHGGEPVPLTDGNYSHVGNASGPGADLVNDVMNGVVSKLGRHYELSAVDVGVLADLGYELTPAGRALLGLSPVPEPASLLALTVGLLGVGVLRVSAGRRRAA